jgi:inositol oxygenase
MKEGFRNYSNIDNSIKNLYLKSRTNHTFNKVGQLKQKYSNLDKEIKIWDAIDLLSGFIDISDPDITLPNLTHLYQTAEGIRKDNLPDWLQLVGFIHDLGKIIYIRGCDDDGTTVDEQWGIVGDTFIVGCKLPDKIIYPEFNMLNTDTTDIIMKSKYGIYQHGCGLDNCHISYGHDEYLYQVLSQNKDVKLPKEALYIIRYHSLYSWHTYNEYQHLENSHDRAMKGWVLLFNQYDLYTKTNKNYTEVELKELKDYYSSLIHKYLPNSLLF